jgi:regulator of replication initiation timing
MAENTITYNGTEYGVEDLSDRAKYIIEQVNELRLEERDLRNKLTRLDVTAQRKLVMKANCLVQSVLVILLKQVKRLV